MSDGMGREFTYLSSHATNRYFIPNWGITLLLFMLLMMFSMIVFIHKFISVPILTEH